MSNHVLFSDYERFPFFYFILWSRNARTSMKPDAVEDSVFLQERTLVKSVKVIPDEVVNGEYGLVINGHSLVCLKKVPNYHACCEYPF